MARVSVIIPVYNVEKYLPRCLDSILAQTFADWEAVCVNDGSTDGSRDILKEYAERDGRFRVIDKENGGLSDARNAGTAAAGGEFVMFVDSDDFIHPQTLELATGLQRKTGTDIVSWVLDRNYRKEALKLMLRGEDALGYRPESFFRKYEIEDIRCHVTHDLVSHVTEKNHCWLLKNPLKHFYPVRHLIRKSVVENVPFIKGVTYEDFPWWSEVLLKNPSDTITGLPLYYYYPNPDSIDNSSARIKRLRAWLLNLEYCMKKYREKADEHQMKKWSSLCKWPVIRFQIARNLSVVRNEGEYSDLRDILVRLDRLGTFDDAGLMNGKYRNRINDCINRRPWPSFGNIQNS